MHVTQSPVIKVNAQAIQKCTAMAQKFDLCGTNPQYIILHLLQLHVYLIGFRTILAHRPRICIYWQSLLQFSIANADNGFLAVVTFLHWKKGIFLLCDRASREFWENLKPASGRPNCPAMSESDRWGITAVSNSFHKDI